jgi:uncharacterized membrane protein
VRTERGFERIINFSDATVAIALTLLVLPLVDIGQGSSADLSVWQLLQENTGTIFSFLLSFAVVWVLWVAHHHTLEYFRAYDRVIMRLHVLWLLTIVVLPFTTQLLADRYEGGAVVLYVAVLFLSSLMLHLMSRHGRREPELLHQDRAEVQTWLAEPMSWTTVIMLGVILLVVLLFPALGAWPLILLFFDNVVDQLLARRRLARSRTMSD